MDNYPDAMENRALWYYDEGHTCAECVLKAAEDIYGLETDERLSGVCAVLSNGMGIGCFCGAVMSGLMVFGLMFDSATAKRMRIRLLWEFNEEFPNFNCNVLKNQGCDGCVNVTACVCRLVETIIADETRPEE